MTAFNRYKCGHFTFSVDELGKGLLDYVILELYEIVEKVGEAHAVLGENCEPESSCDIH